MLRAQSACRVFLALCSMYFGHWRWTCIQLFLAVLPLFFQFSWVCKCDKLRGCTSKHYEDGILNLQLELLVVWLFPLALRFSSRLLHEKVVLESKTKFSKEARVCSLTSLVSCVAQQLEEGHA